MAALSGYRNSSSAEDVEAEDRQPEPESNLRTHRILHNVDSGIPIILGLGTRMSDPYVYAVLGVLNTQRLHVAA